MPLKNSNAVAVERRTDLASLFCMIGRHGPAVVLAAVALVSVLAAFIIYRTVRGKRRKATAAAADGDGRRAAEERGASASRPEHEPNPQETFSYTDSTDVSDEGSSDAKEELFLIQSHPKIRLRRAAASEKNPPPCSSAHGGRQVFEEDAQEDKNDVEITDENRQEAETALNGPVHFDQTSCMSENIDETLQDTEAETNSAEPGLEKSYRGKDERFKAQNLHLLNREDKINQGEDEAMAAVHCGDDQMKESVKECESIQSDENSLLGITSDSKAKISGTADFKEHQYSQKPEKEGEVTWFNIPRPDLISAQEETQPGPVAVLAEESQPQQNCSDWVSSATDACDDVSVCAPAISEGTSDPFVTSGRDQPRDVSEVTSPTDLVLTGVNNPSICKINPLSFEQSKLTENDQDDASSPGLGAESGISSMAVSPDLQVAGNERDMAVNTAAFPAMVYYVQPDKRTETQNCLFAAGAASSVINDHYKSVNSQKPLSESTDWAKYESAAANEDVFGHEVDDCYHGALDQYAAQVAASVTSEPKKKTDKKDAAESVEIGEGCGESVKTKNEMQVKKESEEECEKNEISIMEATMDNNEWITDSNYQALPWMNVCTSPFAQGDRKPSHVPSEAGKRSPPLRDAARDDTATPASTEFKPKHASPGEEDSENSRKVVAVQPMPQHVSVTFRIHYVAHSPYQTVAVTGNQQELGNWKEFIPLERAKDGHWAAVVSLPAESHVEWKFVLLDKGEVCRWEECGNRLLDTSFGEDVMVHKWWGLL